MMTSTAFLIWVAILVTAIVVVMVAYLLKERKLKASIEELELERDKAITQRDSAFHGRDKLLKQNFHLELDKERVLKRCADLNYDYKALEKRIDRIREDNGTLIDLKNEANEKAKQLERRVGELNHELQNLRHIMFIDGIDKDEFDRVTKELKDVKSHNKAVVDHLNEELNCIQRRKNYLTEKLTYIHSKANEPTVRDDRYYSKHMERMAKALRSIRSATEEI